MLATIVMIPIYKADACALMRGGVISYYQSHNKDNIMNQISLKARLYSLGTENYT